MLSTDTQSPEQSNLTGFGIAGSLLGGVPVAPNANTGGNGQGAAGSSAVAAKAGSGATPAWVSSLQDTVIKADMTAAGATGTVTEAGMATLFTDLVSELRSGNTTLSSSQLSDLRTIAADLNVGESASAYLTYITNALVNTNAANTYWTGGGASTTSLGNLAVGETVTKLGELEGKWFLGTDRPNNTVAMSGAQTFTVTYSANSLPLYGTGNVPSMNDVNQGYLGDCYLLSALAEVAYKNPSVIKSMITDNGNGTYGVRYYVNGTAEYVTVSNMLANGGTEFNVSSNGLWASLAEQAYAQVQAISNITGNGTSYYNYGNSFSTIGNGGYAEYTLAEITGATQITDFNASGSSWTKDVYNNSINYISGAAGQSTATVLSAITAALAAGDDVLLGSNTDAYDSQGRQTLVADHELSIYGYNSSTGNLQIRNPWGTYSGQYWDTTFEVSLSTLLAAGDTITMDNAGTGGGGGTTVANALVSAAAGLQTNASVTSFSVLDSSAHVWNALSSLNGDSKLTSISFTDGSAPSLSLTGTAYAADASVLAKIASAYRLTVTGASVAQASGLQSNSNVTSFTVSDSAAAVSAGLAALAGDSKLSSIALTGGGKPTLSLTYAVYSADSAALNKISSSFNLTVTEASATQASGLQSNSKVTSFTVSDSAAAVSSGLAALARDSKLSSIALTDSSKPAMSLTYAVYNADLAVLNKISSSFYLNVTGASAAQASSLQSNSKVTSFTVSDTEANVYSKLTALAGDSKLTSIALTNPSQTMSLTFSAYKADASVLDKIAAYKIAISGASMATKGGSLDLTSLSFSSGHTTVGFSGTASGGTLTVSNGAQQSVSAALLGNYLSSAFTAASDGHGGTLITDAAKSVAPHLFIAPRPI